MHNPIHAIVVLTRGNNPCLQTLAQKDVGHGQVRVRVKACALNFSDLLMIGGKYQDMPSYPMIPGMEIAGDIVEIGSGITNFSIGDSIVAFCGHGGLSDNIVISADRCLLRPATLDAIHGATFPIAYGTSHLALSHRAGLQVGERLVVLGAGGGVGLTAVEIGAALGAHVTAVARGPEKLAAAKAAGASVLIDSSQTPDLRDAILSKGRTDVIYDAVGGALGDAAMRTLAPEGRYLLIGFASGKQPQLKPNHLLVKNISVIGLNLSGYMSFRPDLFTASLEKLFIWHAAGRIRPQISQVLPLERTLEGLDMLRDRNVTGKVVITP
ncbi:NADPH:quinone oxidoreductase family protein [Rhodobacteraceae bacterium]|nr:NADPH:quinone oxidoreductase family protein [Paracoccaceae bacterium]